MIKRQNSLSCKPAHSPRSMRPFTMIARQAVKRASGRARSVLANSQREYVVALAAQFKLPVIYGQREYAEIGGLFSYGTNFAARRLSPKPASTSGKLLKGTRKPNDLPILQPTKYEFVINLRTAKMLRPCCRAFLSPGAGRRGDSNEERATFGNGNTAFGHIWPG